MAALPDMFIAIDTAFYKGMYHQQKLGGELVSKLDSLIALQKKRIENYEAQKDNYELAQKSYQKMITSFEAENKVLHKQLRRRKIWGNIAKVAIPLSLGTGIFVGSKL